MLVMLLLVFGCEDDTLEPDPDGDSPGDPDGDTTSPDGDDEWNPDGDETEDTPCQGGYGYGYGDDCAPNELDCSQEPCVFGVCVGSGASAHCVCREGYAGRLCDACAPGYVVRGLRCVPRDACEDYHCIYGTCRVVNVQPICDCDVGYAGDHCDRCGDGYREEALRCVPDED